MSPSSIWKKAKMGGKSGYDKGWACFERMGKPVNKVANKLGSEAFWPTQMDRECDKAARILKSFCKDGFYRHLDTHQKHGPKKEARVLVRIPQTVVQECVGLAIFTTMRAGFTIAGSAGSGILIAKTEDGNWSPPSGILVQTFGAGWLFGVDIYDCVVVIRTRKALDAFTRVRVTLGGEISGTLGPLGVGGVVESEVRHNSHELLHTYMRSRGLYHGIQINGTVILERSDTNARFYGKKISAKEILSGTEVGYPPETVNLIEVLKSAEGNSDFDQAVRLVLNRQLDPSEINDGWANGGACPPDYSTPSHRLHQAMVTPPVYSPSAGGQVGGVEDEKDDSLFDSD